MQFIDNYFIAKRLKELEYKHDMMNIQENMKTAVNIVIVIPSNIDFLKNIFSIKRTIRSEYPEGKISFMTLSYFHLYKEILEADVHTVSAPTPTKFRELDNIKLLKKKLGSIDLYYDFSDMKCEYRMMFKRILKPQVAVATFNECLKEDFNILVKAKDEVNLLEMMGMNIDHSQANEIIKEKIGKISTEKFDIVYIGNDRKIRNGVKASMTQGRRFMHIANLDEKLSLGTIKHIANTREILTDKHNDEAVKFIRKLVH